MICHPTAAEPLHLAPGLHANVVFTDATPLSANNELARRLLSIGEKAKLAASLAKLNGRLREQPLDPSAERFTVYVPAREPPNGYRLLVFVPPWNDARLPLGWRPVLEKNGVIFVTAAKSGNDDSPLARRDPLALIGYGDIAETFHLDPEHVWIGGFSGGGRIAERLAVGYPDVFHGAILNAGSDPIGGSIIPLPPRELFDTLTASRFVFATGDDDQTRAATDLFTADSMAAWCVFGVSTIKMSHTGHAPVDPDSLQKAFDFLLGPSRADAAKLQVCRKRIETKFAAVGTAFNATISAR